ncbi:ATP-dependent protease subunit HslV [Agrilactobacillus composti DSM 18527 = JCM 14202]|uniref:ATP-dependent protease subunit HslV n=1 Tax=Agrilactobacillus composti DSM 18527 = JCM 14202 TaxID=1423734 RepID=X0PDH0_9LACO|nr:ATP-dependent protease subunit HslV [Agrilactobacillus composti]KRM36532.1 ATP-dependent protease subunit HslV [Agrilactobacillus composti DSM 18527 = JCM 14202]GAF39159.1 ATP-dependent protease HslV [Agrilactobacillus composti DSM 18527 = JCM 14202]
MTTIVAVKHNNETAIAGDGQVTMAEKYIMKGTAQKVRRIYNGNVIIGFAGGVADAFTLSDWLEKKLESYSGNLKRAAVELAQDWRKDPTLQKLEALLIAMDKDNLLVISGNGEVIDPDDNVVAIGSGGNFAQAAAIAMTHHAKDMAAKEIAIDAINIAADIDIFTNHNVIADDFKEK